MKMSKAKRTEAEQFDSVGEKFDVIFDQLPDIESFIIRVGARWPDPHLSEPEFRLDLAGKGGKSISESMRNSLEFLVETILVSEGLIRKSEFEYSAVNKNAKYELNGAVFTKGFRMTPMEEIYEVEDDDEKDELPSGVLKKKFGL